MADNYQIISSDGVFMPRQDYRIELGNRAFRFGDGLFETMHANGLEVQFLEQHFFRLTQGAKQLKIDLPDSFTLDYLKNHISGLLSRCKLFQGAKVRVMVCRSGKGLYIPETNVASVLIEADYFSKGPYVLNTEGLVVGVYEEPLVKSSMLAPFKTMNALPYVLAGVFVRENDFDDCLLVNENGFIVEGTSSNLFCFAGKVLHTPALSLGCVSGIMRAVVIEIARKMGYEINAEARLKPSDLLEMDELFLTNAVSGIKWIAGYKNKRYYRRDTNKLFIELNDLV